MKQAIVLLKNSTHEGVAFATVMLFDNIQLATEYCEKYNTENVNHWAVAKIFLEVEEVELAQSE